MNEVMDKNPGVEWEDIAGRNGLVEANNSPRRYSFSLQLSRAVTYFTSRLCSAGLEFPKRCVMEAVIWPMMRPDIFTGLRGPPKGLLLFGPPG